MPDDSHDFTAAFVDRGGFRVLKEQPTIESLVARRISDFPEKNFNDLSENDQNKLIRLAISDNNLPLKEVDLTLWARASHEELIRSEIIHNTQRAIEAQQLSDEIDRSNDNFGKVCRVNVSRGNESTTGTGLFLSDTLLITCYHVIFGKGATADSPHEISIDVPYTRGKTIFLEEISGWSIIRYDVTNLAGGPNIISESPARPEAEETGSWNESPSSGGLDYCLIEIDKDKQTWTMAFEGTLDGLKYTNFQLHDRFELIIPDIKQASFQVDELDGESVTVNTLTTDLVLEPKSAGSVLEYSEPYNRFRYGEGGGFHGGDSGAPLTNSGDRLIGLHNALTDDNKNQAIPIGPIIDHIKNNAPSNARKELIRRGW
ncbi:MAG: hypothetical protein QTN59_06160 [Candidatus Electrothrix communis]|nr:MAG: hypothetical protein QTN59_06160 [Candidatus Electrothrix communis]